MVCRAYVSPRIISGNVFPVAATSLYLKYQCLDVASLMPVSQLPLVFSIFVAAISVPMTTPSAVNN